MSNTNETCRSTISNCKKNLMKDSEKMIINPVKKNKHNVTCCFIPLNECSESGKNPIYNKTEFDAPDIPTGKELTKIIRKLQADLVKNISFNLEMKKIIDGEIKKCVPILHTTVYFKDGTYVKVNNSTHDKISTVCVDAETGKVLDSKQVATGEKTTIRIASDSAKEQAVLYALFKKMMNPGVESGEIDGNGYISEIHKLIKEKAVDQNLKPILKKIDKIKAQKNHEKLLRAAQLRRYEKINSGNLLDVLKNMNIIDLRDFVFDLIEDSKNFKEKREQIEAEDEDAWKNSETKDDSYEDENDWEEDEWEEDDGEPPLFDDEEFEDAEPVKDPRGEYSPKKEI